MALLLRFDSLSKSFGVRPLFNNITLSFADGERTGLIGANGSGKSTLLRILAGLETADSGDLFVNRKTRFVYVPQEDDLPPAQTSRQILTAALTDHHLDEHQRDTQVNIMLGRLGFAAPDSSVSTLSGGWRSAWPSPAP